MESKHHLIHHETHHLSLSTVATTMELEEGILSIRMRLINKIFVECFQLFKFAYTSISDELAKSLSLHFDFAVKKITETDFSEMLFPSVLFLFDFNFIFNCGWMMLLILLRYLPASNNEMEIKVLHAEIYLPSWFLVLLIGALLDSLLLSVRGSMILLWKNFANFLNGKYWRSQLYITLWDPFSIILLSFFFSFCCYRYEDYFHSGFYSNSVFSLFFIPHIIKTCLQCTV